MSSAPFRPRRAARAFSLIEVVVAVGVFALGMVAVVGLFAPVARSVGSTADADAAARVADALRSKLQAMPFATVAAMLKQSTGSSHEITLADARVDYDLTRDPQLLFANRDGSKVGAYADAIWVNAVTRRNWDGEKFFEIALIRNETVSPKAGVVTSGSGTDTPLNPDETAPLLGYTARIRWPAFIADSPTTAVQVGSNPGGTVKFDHSRKQVLFFSGTVTR
jgi:hypothetical protein